MTDIIGSVVTDFSTRGAEGLQQTFEKLIGLQNTLTGKTQEHVKSIASMYDKYKDSMAIAGGNTDAETKAFAELNNGVLSLGRSLKALQTGQKGLDLVKSDDVAKVKELMQQFKELDTFFQNTKKQQEIGSGTFGLNPKSIAEAKASLKTLESAVNSVRGAMLLPGANTEKLRADEIQIKKNTGALIAQADALRKFKTLESAQVEGIKDNGIFDKRKEQQYAAQQEQALKMNVKFDKDKAAQEAATQEAAIKANIVFDKKKESQEAETHEKALRADAAFDKERAAARAARAQAQLERAGTASLAAERDKIQLNYSPLGNAYQQIQSGLNVNQMANAVRPGVNSARNDFVSAKADADVLKSIYSDAGLKYSPAKDAIKDGDRVRQITAQIVELEKQLLGIRENGNKDLEKEAGILGQIRNLRNGQDKARQDEKISDPVLRKENQNRQAVSMISRTSGEGGAALLAVQASLMANYAVLNGVVGSVKSGITNAIELEATFKNLQAVTDTTRTEMVGLQKTIMDVATTTKFSAVQVAEGALILGQAGLSTKQIEQSIQPIVMLATAAGTSIAQAVDLVTSVVGVFNKQASETGDIANKITQAANSSKVSVEKLAEGFQYAGNLAAQLGVSFEETTAAMATMANAGIKSGSTMGTGLRQFLNELEKPSAEFVKVINQIGLSVSDLDLRANGLSGVAKKLAEAGFVAKDAIKAFDVRGAAAFNALLANPEDFQRQLDMLHDTSAATKANDIQMESLKNQAMRLGSAFNNTVAIGLEPFAKVLTLVTKGVADLFTELSQHEILLGIVGTFLASFAATAAISHIKMLITGFVELRSIMTLASVAMGATTVATVGLSTAMAATGVGAIVLLVAGLVALYNGMENTKDTTDKLVASLNEAKGAVDEKKSAIKDLTAKIDELTLRQDKLKDGSIELKNEALDINAKFGAWGFTIDLTNTKLTTMVGKMEALRESMRKMLLDDMNAVTVKAQKVAQDAADRGKDAQDSFNNGIFKNPRAALGLLTEKNNLDMFVKKGMLTEEQAATLKAANSEVRTDKTSDQMQSVSPAALVLSRLKGNKGIPDDLKGVVDMALGGLQNLSGAAADIRRTARDAAGASQDATIEGNYQKSDSAYKQKYGTSFSSKVTATQDFDSQAKKALSAEDAKDPVKVNAKIKQLLLAYDQSLDNALKGAEAFDDPKTLETMKAQVNTAKSNAREQLTKQAQYATEWGAETNAMSKATLDAQRRNLERRMKLGTLSSGDLTEATSNLKQTSAMEFNQKTLGMRLDDPRYKAMSIENESKLQADIEALQDKYANAARKVGGNSMKIEGEALKKAVQEAEGKAHEYRSRANSSMTQDQLISLANSGMEELERARDLDRQALEKKTGVQQLRGNQNVTPAMRNAWSSEQTTLERTWTDKINSFGNAFNGLLTSSAQKTFSLTTKLRELQNKVHEMSDQAELRLYAAGAELRAKDSQLAQDKGTVSGRHVSTATTELHTREREPLELANLQRQLQEKIDFLSANQALQEATGATLADQRSTVKSSDATRKAVLNGRDSTELTGGDLLSYNAANSTFEAATAAVEKQDAAYHALTKTIASTRVEIDNINNSIAGSTPGKRDGSDPKVIISDLTDAWKNYKTKVLDDTDVAKTMSEGFSGVANNFSGGLGQAFSSIVSGTKSVKNAFRDMATGVIKAMIDVLAQALAMQAVKGILSMFMTVGGAAVGSYSTPEAAVAALPAANGGGTIVGLATGGYIRPDGVVERVRHMASGGSVYGGISNKDSVPTMLMPGEFVMNKPAVDAVGTDFLHGLNTTTNSVASASSNTNTVAPTNKDSKSGGTVNVYVVSPDQQPSVGPNDIIATVSNNIMTGGSVKQLIKSVQMGTV